MTLSAFAYIQILFLYAAILLVPLALRLLRLPSREGKEDRFYHVALWAYPFGALGALAGVAFPHSPLRYLAVLWCVFTLTLSALGLMRAERRAISRYEENVIHAGMILCSVGGIWFFLSAVGWDVIGFSEPTILLTAIHFHYTAFLTPLFLGLLGRELPRKYFLPWAFSAVTLGLGILLTAIGISCSPSIETIGAFFVAASLLKFAALLVLSATHKRLVIKISRYLAAFSISLGMYWACRYALDHGSVSIANMVIRHGFLNAFGFATPLAISFLIETPKPKMTANGIPVSRLEGNKKIGKQIFHDLGAVPTQGKKILGLVDDLASFDREDFRAANLAPEIRAFYERTSEFSMTVRPVWHFGFQSIGQLYGRWSAKAEQMNLPTDKDKTEEVDSHLFALDDAKDGRSNVRAWIRSYHYSGKAIYAAAYSQHSFGGTTYMNIAFPTWRRNLTSILRPSHGESGEMVLTTFSEPDFSGDEGIYLCRKGRTSRLLMNERIRVWATKEGLMAQHDVWVLGIRFLELHYRMQRVG